MKLIGAMHAISYILAATKKNITQGWLGTYHQIDIVPSPSTSFLKEET
jgi:hypothetical protein